MASPIAHAFQDEEAWRSNYGYLVALLVNSNLMQVSVLLHRRWLDGKHSVCFDIILRPSAMLLLISAREQPPNSFAALLALAWTEIYYPLGALSSALPLSEVGSHLNERHGISRMQNCSRLLALEASGSGCPVNPSAVVISPTRPYPSLPAPTHVRPLAVWTSTNFPFSRRMPVFRVTLMDTKVPA